MTPHDICSSAALLIAAVTFHQVRLLRHCLGRGAIPSFPGLVIDPPHM